MDKLESRVYADEFERRAKASRAKTGPPKLDEITEEIIKSTGEWDPTRPRRTLQNHVHRLHASTVLFGDAQGWEKSPFAWLFMKKTILAELGRLEDPDEIRVFAKVICEADPKPITTDVIRRIRHHRRGDAPAPSRDGLQTAIVKAIEAYAVGHPGLTFDEIEDACLGAIATFEPESNNGD